MHCKCLNAQTQSNGTDHDMPALSPTQDQLFAALQVCLDNGALVGSMCAQQCEQLHQAFVDSASASQSSNLAQDTLAEPAPGSTEGSGVTLAADGKAMPADHTGGTAQDGLLHLLMQAQEVLRAQLREAAAGSAGRRVRKQLKQLVHERLKEAQKSLLRLDKAQQQQQQQHPAHKQQQQQFDKAVPEGGLGTVAVPGSTSRQQFSGPDAAAAGVRAYLSGAVDVLRVWEGHLDASRDSAASSGKDGKRVAKVGRQDGEGVKQSGDNKRSRGAQSAAAT